MRSTVYMCVHVHTCTFCALSSEKLMYVSYVLIVCVWRRDGEGYPLVIPPRLHKIVLMIPRISPLHACFLFYLCMSMLMIEKRVQISLLLSISALICCRLCTIEWFVT